MLDRTQEIHQDLQALLSHAAKARWLLARLHNLGSEPKIWGLRIDERETVVITDVSVIHSPTDWHTLLGVYRDAQERAKQQQEAVARDRKRILEEA